MTARTVIQSNGRAYRVALRQPPHFRKGRDADPVIDTVAVEVIKALATSGIDRNANYRSNGARPPAA